MKAIGFVFEVIGIIAVIMMIFSKITVTRTDYVGPFEYTETSNMKDVVVEELNAKLEDYGIELDF